MDHLNDREYYVARAATSRDLAQRATDPSIAAIHGDLASRYDALAAQREQKIDGTIADNQAT